MNAEKNPILQQASNDLYTINADEIFRQQARARADAEFWERHTKAKIQQLEEALAQKDRELVTKDNALTAKDNELATKDNEIERLRTQLSTQDK